MFKNQLAHHESYSKTTDGYDLDSSYSVYEVFIELGRDKEGNVLKNRDGSDRYFPIQDENLTTLKQDVSVKIIREDFFKPLFEVNGDKVEKVEKDGRRIYYSVEEDKIKVLQAGTKVVITKNGGYKVPSEVGYVLVDDFDIDNPRVIMTRKFTKEDHKAEAEEIIKNRVNRL